MSRLDYEKAKRQRRRPNGAKRKRRAKPVHPNSTAARKWGRRHWFTSD